MVNSFFLVEEQQENMGKLISLLQSWREIKKKGKKGKKRRGEHLGDEEQDEDESEEDELDGT